MTILVGIVYPLVITAVAKVAFPRQAAGSLLYRDGKLVGSALIGQNFSDPRYFWGRPSATTPQPYNGVGSTGSNLGPLNPALIDQVKANAKALRDADPENRQPIPVDLVTTSGSGLDPDITPAAAGFQVPRVAKARNLSEDKVRALVADMTQDRFLGILGEKRVNVLNLNLALDQLH